MLELENADALVSNLTSEASRFVIVSSDGIFHQTTEPDSAGAVFAMPLYLSASEVNKLIHEQQSLPIVSCLTIEQIATDKSCNHILAWVGKYQDTDFFVLRIDERIDPLVNDDDDKLRGGRFLPLREFGDLLSNTVDAGLLATANGLVEFHKANGFCSHCGSPTRSRKVGSSRICVSCKRPVYPRLDVASIMLIVSPCGNYALLGRKASWPAGRYSALAGFQEVGETMEECCIRETWEESGVAVDPTSVQFVASQPWPFPQSLMVGFHARASTTIHDDSGLPTIKIDKDEMEDIQWFSREYVRDRLDGGSTAMLFKPSQSEAEFHLPGRSSLARVLIGRWARSDS